MTPLRPIEARPTAVDACAASLRDAVLKGDFEEGVRLPPERNLAETLKVNRVTVRGALAKLVSEGLLSVRQGSGYVVQDFLARGGLELLAPLTRQGDRRAQVAAVKDLLEVRRALAAVVLRRLVERPARRPALDQLAQAIDAMEQVASGSVSEVAEADLAVLAAVVAATGSAAFRLTLNPVAEVLRALPGLQAAMFRAPLENVSAWRVVHGLLSAPTTEGIDLVVSALEARDAQTLAGLPRG